jgi:mono/diheme cytochrome c family protein
MRKVVFTIVMAFLLVLAAACGPANNDTNGQVPETGDDAALQQQVSRGSQVFIDRCDVCHQIGGSAPTLDAPNLAEYGTAHALYNYTSSTMPLDDPGGLTEQEYWDVTAFMLSETGQLNINEPLGPGNAEGVNID